jgi:hypothetical protein
MRSALQTPGLLARAKSVSQPGRWDRGGLRVGALRLLDTTRALRPSRKSLAVRAPPPPRGLQPGPSYSKRPRGTGNWEAAPGVARARAREAGAGGGGARARMAKQAYRSSADRKNSGLSGVHFFVGAARSPRRLTALKTGRPAGIRMPASGLAACAVSWLVGECRAPCCTPRAVDVLEHGACRWVETRCHLP